MATITLSRPDRLNAFSSKMREELGACLADVAPDPAVRVVLLRAEGRVFSAGGDLGESPEGAMGWRERVQVAQAQHLAIMRMQKPVIAAVQGAAVGGAASLALAADILLMSDDAALVFPFVKIGMVPDGGAAFLLQRKASAALALDVLLTGGTVSAAEALKAGLTRRVVPRQDLEAQSRQVAAELARVPNEALVLTKSLVSQVWACGVHGFLDHEADAMGVAVTTDGHRQALAKWREEVKTRRRS